MKRSGPLERRTPLQSRTPLKRTGNVRAKRPTPRRRPAPRWGREAWESADRVLQRRCGGFCEICGTASGPFERHHRKRRRDGGDRFSNLLYLCRDCHRHVTEHPAEARKYGWIVSVSREPDEIPVLWRRREWLRLDDAGQTYPAFGAPEDAHA